VTTTGAANVVATLGRVLRERGVSWYLFETQAVIYWGRPRLSADVDITVRLPLGKVRDLAAALLEVGFYPLVEKVVEFVERTRVLPLEHRSTGLPVDVVFGGSGLEDEFFERAMPVEIGGEQVSIITPEDLVVTKILAGRPKDIEDARGILAVRGPELDLDRCRSLLVRLERALDRSDLVRELDRLARAADRS
jgi:Nucleotidyltransferase of unknown function (DUF6036)